MDKESSEPGRVVTLLGVASVLTLAFGGYVKASDYLSWIPVDLTALGAVGAAIFVARSALLNPLGMRHGWAMGALLTACVGGLFVVGAQGNDYAQAKLVHVFVLAPLCVLAGSYILRSRRARAEFLVGVVLLGFVVLGFAWINPATTVDRFVGEDASTINAGRAAGAAAVVLLLTAVASRPRRAAVLLALGGVAALGALGVASRGPVLAAAVAVAVTVVFVRARGRFWRAGIVAVGALLLWQWAVVEGVVNDRLTTLSDTSADARRLMWTKTWGLIQQEPMGIGWGRLYEHVGRITNGEGWEQYPHNVVLEVTVEAGWLAGVCLLGALYLTFRRQLELAHSSRIEAVMFGLLLFAFVNAMVSGDVTSNRGLWVAMGAALATPIATPLRGRSEDQPGGSSGKISRSRSVSCSTVTPSSHPAAMPVVIFETK